MTQPTDVPFNPTNSSILPLPQEEGSDSSHGDDNHTATTTGVGTGVVAAAGEGDGRSRGSSGDDSSAFGSVEEEVQDVAHVTTLSVRGDRGLQVADSGGQIVELVPPPAAAAVSVSRSRENPIPNKFVDVLSHAIQKKDVVSMRQARVYIGRIAQAGLDALEGLLAWSEKKENASKVDRWMKAEMPDLLSGGVQRVSPEQRSAFLREFVCAPFSESLTHFATATKVGQEISERAARWSSRRSSQNPNAVALECTERVCTIANMLPPQFHEFSWLHTQDPVGEEIYFSEEHVPHFLPGAILCLCGFRRNGSRDNSRDDCLSCPWRTPRILAELDRVLNSKRLTNRSFMGSGMAKYRHRADRMRKSLPYAINREGTDGKRMDHDVRLETADVEKVIKEHWMGLPEPRSKKVQFDLEEDLSRAIRETLDGDNSKDHSVENTFDGGLGGHSGGLGTDDAHVLLKPLGHDVLRHIFKNLDMPFEDSTRFTLKDGCSLLECDRFPLGDPLLAAEAIASLILVECINERKVPLDVFLRTGPKARTILGLDGTPSRPNERPSLVVGHQWLTRSERQNKKGVIGGMCRGDILEQTEFVVGALTILGFQEMFSDDVRDAMVLIQSASFWDVDLSKNKESCIRAGVLGMEGDHQKPYFSLGQGKVVLSQDATKADKAWILMGNELINLHRMIQNDIYRLICGKGNDDISWKWLDLYNDSPTYSPGNLSFMAPIVVAGAGHVAHSPPAVTPGRDQQNKRQRLWSDRTTPEEGGQQTTDPHSPEREQDNQDDVEGDLIARFGVGLLGDDDWLPSGTSDDADSIFVDGDDDPEQRYQQRVDCLEQLHQEAFGDRSDNPSTMPEDHAIYERIRNQLTIVPGHEPIFVPLKKFEGNSVITRGGAGADYGPHTDAKATLNSTPSFPGKVLSDNLPLDTQKTMAVATACIGLAGTSILTSVQHGDFEKKLDPCTSLTTGTNSGHYQPPGSQAAGEHKGAPHPNRGNFRQCLYKYENFEHLPEDVRDEYLPPELREGQPGLPITNGRFVMTIRRVPKGGQDLGVYACGIVAEGLHVPQSVVYNKFDRTRIAFGRIPTQDTATNDWHHEQPKGFFEAQRDLYIRAMQERSRGGDSNTSHPDMVTTDPGLGLSSAELADVIRDHVPCQKAAPTPTWLACHEEKVQVEGNELFEHLNAKAIPRSGWIKGVSLPERTVRMSHKGHDTAMSRVTTQILLQERKVLCLTEDTGEADSPQRELPESPLWLHPEQKKPFPVGALVSGSDTTLDFKQRNNEIVEKNRKNQTVFFRMYKVDQLTQLEKHVRLALVTHKYTDLEGTWVKYKQAEMYLGCGEPYIPISPGSFDEKIETAERIVAAMVAGHPDVPVTEGSGSRGEDLAQELLLGVDQNQFGIRNCREVSKWLLTSTDSKAQLLRSMLAPDAPEEQIDRIVRDRKTNPDLHPYAESARRILTAEQQGCSVGDRLTAQQILDLVASEDTAKQVCELAEMEFERREKHKSMVAELPFIERLLYELHMMLDHDPLIQIGSSGSAMEQGSNSMTASSSSPDDAHMNLSTPQDAASDINKVFSEIAQMGNAVTVFVNMEEFHKLKRAFSAPWLREAEKGDSNKDSLLCIGHYEYIEVRSMVRKEPAEILGSVACYPGFFKRNCKLQSFFAAGCRKHTLRRAFDFGTMLRLIQDWQNPTSDLYSTIPVNSKNIGPAFPASELNMLDRGYHHKRIASRVMKSEFGRDDWQASHCSNEEIIWTRYRTDHESLLEFLGATDSAATNQDRITQPVRRLPLFTFTGTEMSCMSAQIMHALSLRALQRNQLEIGKTTYPIPLVCDGADFLVDPLREGPMPSSVTSLDLARCFFRKNATLMMEALGGECPLQHKKRKLPARYYPDLDAIDCEHERAAYEKLAEIFPKDVETIQTDVFDKCEKGAPKWEQAAELYTRLVYTALVNRTSGRVSFFLSYPTYKEKLAEKSKEPRVKTSYLLPPPEEAQVFYDLLESCATNAKFEYAHILSDQHAKQMLKEWRRPKDGIRAYRDFLLNFVTDGDCLPVVNKYFRSVLVPGGNHSISRKMLRDVIAGAIAAGTTVLASNASVQFLAHQMIHDIECTVPGFAGEDDLGSVSHGFGSKFGAECCSRDMKATGDDEEKFRQRLEHTHGKLVTRLKEEDLMNPLRLLQKGLYITEETGGEGVDTTPVRTVHCLRTGAEFSFSHIEQGDCKYYIFCARSHSSRTGSAKKKNTSRCCFPLSGTEEAHHKLFEADYRFFEVIRQAGLSLGENYFNDGLPTSIRYRWEKWIDGTATTEAHLMDEDDSDQEEDYDSDGEAF